MKRLNSGTKPTPSSRQRHTFQWEPIIVQQHLIALALCRAPCFVCFILGAKLFCNNNSILSSGLVPISPRQAKRAGSCCPEIGDKKPALNKF